MNDKKIIDSSIDNGLLFQEGTESPQLLVIAFSGGAKILMIDPDEFMSETGLINYHRISLRDPFRLWYQHGINDQISSFHQLCEYFKDKIRELNIKKVLVIGTSSGGHAAFLAAHHLKADYAHAFGPQTSIGLCSLREASVKPFKKRWELIRRLYRAHWRDWKNFDLRRALRIYNGKTRYYIHFARDNPYDSARASRMENVKGVKLFSYPYKNHAIVGPMRTNGYLEKMFLNEYLENPQKLFDTFYGSDLRGTPTSNTKESSDKRVAQIIQKIAVSKPDVESICNSKDLPSELALDSIASLELVVELENVFGINIEMDTLEAEDLKNVENILQLVNRSKKSG